MSATDSAARRARMVELVARLAPGEGYTRSRLDSVSLMRCERPVQRTPALYEPSIVIVVQGRKRAFHNDRAYVYDAQHYLALAVPLPFETETEASADEPMFGIALRIDPGAIAELALSLDRMRPDSEVPPATMVASPMDERMSDAAVRLLEALCDPAESALLAPAIAREIAFLALAGEQGGSLRAAMAQGGHFGRIAKALRRIHDQYDRKLDVSSLAGEASMSVAAFHARFKAVTAASPIQYIKAMRLHQARLLMIRNGCAAADAARRVGYESASQFNREFKRMFGRPPLEEARQLQRILRVSEPVQATAGRAARPS
ncbi:AraC family transcriptional regulator [Lysobacter enzymogenes]|nr:AraC family transcriptional regulator [Lysobacter enzymogenes]